MGSERRIAVVAVILENPKDVQGRVNSLISECGEMVIGRMGIPNHERNIGVLSLIVEGTENEINTLTGKLGNIQGVNARATMAKQKEQ
ncbi:MAG TPA: TM1266 family iron-only hydrogenase system putative regulator [Bacillota bacterium]|nr:TM1266 family iron-only hydrogenase system putative regulator [Bacillota bacterium]